MLSTKLKEAAGNSADATPYVDDVFSTYLYTGNGSTQTITNGIDLAGKGGMVWTKARNSAYPHNLVDSVRGILNGNENVLNSATTAGNQLVSGMVISANSNGYTTGGAYQINENAINYASWTFRKAKKFFDVVTFTTSNGYNWSIPHNLGIAPGFIIIKRTDSSSPWICYHRSLTSNRYSMYLDKTDNQGFNPGGPPIEVYGDSYLGWSGFNTYWSEFQGAGTYVAYLFAHDPSPEGIIQCGSYTAADGNLVNVNLGFEPQFLMIKNASSGDNWFTFDTMRGVGATGQYANYLMPNSNVEEGVNSFNTPNLTSTGFSVKQQLNTGTNTYIYMAIRRPNKPPTSGTQVYNAAFGNGSAPAFTSGFPVDMGIYQTNTSGGNHEIATRLLSGTGLYTNASDPEFPRTTNKFDYQKAYSSSAFASNVFSYMFKRAPGFFDVVCYTGDGTSSRTIPMSFKPGINAMIIIKPRDTTSYFNDWKVYHVSSVPGVFYESFLLLNKSDSFSGNNLNGGYPYYSLDNTNSFRVINFNGVENVNETGIKYVAYIFGTLAGISKLGRYIGNGSSQNIECGFASGARFVLIKRHDSAGDWYVWDTARGIVTGNDPHLSLNTTAAEVTTDDSIDPYSAGFTVNQLEATNINVTSATYIFLAIA